jgi:5'-methylthioadenosine phosphorylase
MSKPVIGIIGGTGLGDVLAKEASRELHDIATPFGKPSAPVMTWEWHDVRIAFISRHGIGHVIPPSSVPFRANIFALKTLGVTHLLASGAVGSLREHIEPRHLVVPDQVIDKTVRRAGTFFDEGLAVHVELSHPFCQGLRERVLSLDDQVDTVVHTGGTYVCMEGPQFSTVAESEMHRAWGGDLIGMTVMPEAKLAREAEMCYALVALATDYDCWRPHDPNVDRQALLAEILSHLRAATDYAVQLIRATVADLAKRPPERCSCHDALQLAIWSNKSDVQPALVRKLGPLVGRYFGDTP